MVNRIVLYTVSGLVPHLISLMVKDRDLKIVITSLFGTVIVNEF